MTGATAYRAADICAVCGRPVHALSKSENTRAVYHGWCYRRILPPATPPKPLTLYSHDDRVRDGMEYP